MPNGYDKNWHRLCWTVGGFLQQHGSWPDQISLKPMCYGNLRRALFSAEGWSRLGQRLRVEQGHDFVAEDARGHRYAHGEGDAARSSIQRARVWLGMEPDLAEDGSVIPLRDRPWTIVGVDCATQPKRTGLACGSLLRGSTIGVREIAIEDSRERIVSRICSWLRSADRTLVAIDAPLGWPVPLAQELVDHLAGDALGTQPNRLFRRHTDRVVRARTGKLPLEIGADRIARTAVAGLDLLERVRREVGPLPLLWGAEEGSGVVEVYPAVTLMSRQIDTTGYKTGAAAPRRRVEVVGALEEEMALVPASSSLVRSDDLIDAAACVLAGADFPLRRCVRPAEGEERDLAGREGWIWFAQRGTSWPEG